MEMSKETLVNTIQKITNTNIHHFSPVLFAQVVVGSRFQQLSRRLGVTIATQVILARDWSMLIT